MNSAGMAALSDEGSDDNDSMPGLTPVRSMSEEAAATGSDRESSRRRGSPEAPVVEYSGRTDYVIMANIEEHEVGGDSCT